MNLHIIIHEIFEAPGAIEDWIRSNGHGVAYTRLYEGDKLPEERDFDALIVMGGPQSPATSVEECPHFDAQAEIAFIRGAADEGKALLGVCLGAQLIGGALGARFEHSPDREIGVFPVILTEEGLQDSIVCTFPREFLVGHWHGDMPGLSSESKILATSEGCPRQIVRYSSKIYGFQCHFEFTPAVIEGLIENSESELEEYKALPYVETPEQLRAHDYSTMNSLLFEFLDNWSSK